MPTKQKDLNSTQSYINQIQRYELLTPQREHELAIAAANGDAAAKEEMVNHNLRLVIFVAKPYLNKGIPFDDLIQEGNRGLITAVEKYDITKGCKFSTYAVYWIKHYIMKTFIEQKCNIRLPANISILEWRVKKEIQQYENNTGCSPSNEEIAKTLNIPLETVQLIRELPIEKEQVETNLDEEIAQDDFFKEIYDSQAKEVINKVLDTLSPTEKTIIKLRFGLGSDPKTLEEIGKILHISTTTVFRIQNTALQKLRQPCRAKILREFLDEN